MQVCSGRPWRSLATFPGEVNRTHKARSERLSADEANRWMKVSAGARIPRLPPSDPAMSVL
jgi:hypothetical protein